MEQRTKGWISKLFAIAVFALMIFQAVKFLHPMTRDNSRYDGICNISSLLWYSETCMRQPDNYHMYDVPKIGGGFVELDGRPAVSAGTIIRANSTATLLDVYYLWVNESNTDDYGDGGPEVQALLFDDNSDHPLINCSNANIISTKKMIVYYIPQLEPFLYMDSSTRFKGRPDFYFNCTYDNHHGKQGAYLQYKRTSKLLLIPFFITLFTFILGLQLIHKNDVDGPIKELAEFILQLLFMVVFGIHYVFYLVFRVFIGQAIFNIEAADPMDDFKAGSIFFPIVWLLKKAWKVFRRSNHCFSSNATEDSNGAGTEAAPASSESMPTEITRRSSVPEINTRPHAPPHHLPKPPSYPSIDTEGTVIPNTVIEYRGDSGTDLEVLPPPPSYDDVVNNNTGTYM